MHHGCAQRTVAGLYSLSLISVAVSADISGTRKNNYLSYTKKRKML